MKRLISSPPNFQSIRARPDTEGFLTCFRDWISGLCWDSRTEEVEQHLQRSFRPFLEGWDRGDASVFEGRMMAWWAAVHVPQSEYLPRILHALVVEYDKPPMGVGPGVPSRTVLAAAALLAAGEYLDSARPLDRSRSIAIDSAYRRLCDLKLACYYDGSITYAPTSPAIALVKSWAEAKARRYSILAVLAETYERDVAWPATSGVRALLRKGDIIMGDKYSIHGQAGAVGRGAHAHDMALEQLWSAYSSEIDLSVLAKELFELQRAATERAGDDVEAGMAVRALAEAKQCASSGNGPATLRNLRKAGRWALEVAEKIGVRVAAEAIKVAAGL